MLRVSNPFLKDINTSIQQGLIQLVKSDIIMLQNISISIIKESKSKKINRNAQRYQAA